MDDRHTTNEDGCTLLYTRVETTKGGVVVMDGKVTRNYYDSSAWGAPVIRQVEEYDKCYDVQCSPDNICEHCGHCATCGNDVVRCNGDLCEGEVSYHDYHICKTCHKCLGYCCTCAGHIAPHRREEFAFREREALAKAREAHEARMAELGITQHALL